MQVEFINSTSWERDNVFASIPQKSPFRFIDDILELSTLHCVGKYRFREDEYFYKGHFPDNPVTPGVILIEAMAQTSVVALGIFLNLKFGQPNNKYTTLFTEAEIEFSNMVRPGETVEIRGDLEFFRRNKIKSRVVMKNQDGSIAASGLLSGLGVNIQ
ncbi:3-hydroxyacyl-ACP dehydratase FabZ family protein [Leptospira sp. GIMC2001]|uniref:3-hydroxyacyl-ACP dehydratase FabZ family protein n=1 Tax=Leptospira sp. GIMC2001 TaxID=1513297 RepID=UPI002349536D|nr:beta-hydroxyacyl-ACP dehydratase [Leptospira sp. GIMC2001]WCL50181.1 beta-hydroxyacyl-ACP dehydratase [Leptospira sp. GIMC2001]